MNRKSLLGAMRAMRAIKPPVMGKALAKGRFPHVVVPVFTREDYQKVADYLNTDEGERLIMNAMRLGR